MEAAEAQIESVTTDAAELDARAELQLVLSGTPATPGLLADLFE
jgi:hypothetical protein